MGAGACDGVNCYDGLIEPWEIGLALSRIVELGFPRHQWNDLLQELVVEMLGFRHDPEGAKESTALYAVVSNRLASSMRAGCRDGGRSTSLEALLAAGDDETPQSPTFRFEDKGPMRLDVQEAIESLEGCLPGPLRGETVWQIARRLGCGWHTVNRALARIRGRFRRLGLDGWLGGCIAESAAAGEEG